MQKVVISILHYGNATDTKSCLDSLLLLNLDRISLITYVLDNGSSEPLDLDIQLYSKIGLTLLRNNINAGFTGGHNLVYEKVQDKKFDYFLLLNNDCILHKDCIFQLVKTGDKDEKTGGVVPKIYFTKGYEYHKEKYTEREKGKVIWYAGGYIDWNHVQSKHKGVDEVDNGQYDEEMEVDFGTGACLLLKKQFIENEGLFDEKFFLYFEDADLSCKLNGKGYSIIYQPRAVVWHNNAGSSGSGSGLHDYYLTRNRMLFGMRYAPPRTKAHLIKESLRLLLNGRYWQRIGIRDFYLCKFGQGSYKK